jgi:putative NADH-flavin reductase
MLILKKNLKIIKYFKTKKKLKITFINPKTILSPRKQEGHLFSLIQAIK